MTRVPIDGQIDLDAATYEALLAHAWSDAPYEVCGLLATDGEQVTAHYEIPNAARSMTYYNMEPRSLLQAMHDMEDRGWELLAIYHSHTHTEAFPSATDIELAFYPEPTYLIISLQEPDAPVVRGFAIRDGQVTEQVVMIDGEEAPAGPR